MRTHVGTQQFILSAVVDVDGHGVVVVDDNGCCEVVVCACDGDDGALFT